MLFSLLPSIGSEFLPPGANGEVLVTGEMKVSAPGHHGSPARRLEAIVKAAVPEAAPAVTSVGASGWRPDRATRGENRMSLSPTARRDRSNTEIADDPRRRQAGAIPCMTIRVQDTQGQFLLNRLLAATKG